MHTLKWTCDAQGNWRQVPVVLVRSANGWGERVVGAEQGRKAA